jgi:hypothetical protein
VETLRSSEGRWGKILSTSWNLREFALRHFGCEQCHVFFIFLKQINLTLFSTCQGWQETHSQLCLLWGEGG